MSTVRKPRICLICPCYNEAEVIRLFYNELKPVLNSLQDLDHRIYFMDDGSADATLDVLNAMAREDDKVRVYSFSRNFGHQAAISAGIDVARGDAVIMMDTDLQHPPALIKDLIARWREGFDVVSAVRQSTKDAGIFKRISSNGFYWLFNHMSTTPIITGAADFCLLSKKAVLALRKLPERHRFLRGMISWIGFRRATIPFEAPPRAAGHSKYTLFKMINFALDATFAFSVKPIRMATRLGLLVSCLGLLYIVYALIRHFVIGDTVPGWSSLLSVVLILGGAQLTFIGVIGEYIARVFEEAKGRPLYLFKQRPAKRKKKSKRAASKGESVAAPVPAPQSNPELQTAP